MTAKKATRGVTAEKREDGFVWITSTSSCGTRLSLGMTSAEAQAVAERIARVAACAR